MAAVSNGNDDELAARIRADQARGAATPTRSGFETYAMVRKGLSMWEAHIESCRCPGVNCGDITSLRRTCSAAAPTRDS